MAGLVSVSLPSDAVEQADANRASARARVIAVAVCGLGWVIVLHGVEVPGQCLRFGVRLRATTVWSDGACTGALGCSEGGFLGDGLFLVGAVNAAWGWRWCGCLLGGGLTEQDGSYGYVCCDSCLLH